VSCPAPSSCGFGSPPVTCPFKGTQPTCTAQCLPGAKRCTSDKRAFQVCGDNGKWGTPTAGTTCSATQACVSDQTGVVIGCGDPVCDGVDPRTSGVCVLDSGVSKVRVCGTDGQLTNTVVDCATVGGGLCTNSAPQAINGENPGKCQLECAPGSSRCVGNNSAIQNCGSLGTWQGNTTPCKFDGSAQACVDYTDAVTQQPAAVCGVCAPGDTRCTTQNGDGGANTDFQETCGTNGQWGAPVQCMSSYCPSNAAHGHCQADCLQGSTVCNGDSASASPAPANKGTTSMATCTSDGRIPIFGMDCGVSQTCRKDPNGNSYGCVVCVGAANEDNQVDTRCSPTSNGVETCNATNDGWGAAAACASGTSCQPPSGATPAFCALNP
jgi:hypothetical protein